MHFYPYRVSPMSDATVHDELTFAAWPEEQKRLARTVLTAEIRAECENDRAGEGFDEANELRDELITLKADIRKLLDD